MRIKFDNKFFTILGQVVNVVWISLLWIIFSLPLFTIGASTTALYYTVHKIIFKYEGYIFPTFWQSFKENFKKATIKWLISVAVIAFLSADLFIVKNMMGPENAMAGIYYPLLIALAFAIMCQFSIWAYGARFEDSIMKGLGKSVVITATNLGWTLFLLIMILMALYVCRYLIFMAIILPGGFACLLHHCYEHIFLKNGWIEKEQD